MRVVIYARVSTEEQDPKAQLTELVEFCREKGWEVVKIFEESISGAVPPLERPVFREALKFCSENGVGTVVVYDMTRFFRPEDPVAFFDELKKIMQEHGVMVYFIREPEIQDPHLRRLWELLKAWFAGYERYQIRLRTRYGIEKVRRQGKLYHRPSLAHYWAAYVLNKELRDVTKEDIERTAPKLCKLIEKYLLLGVRKTRLPDVLQMRELADFYARFRKAPKDYLSFKRFMRKYCKGDGGSV